MTPGGKAAIGTRRQRVASAIALALALAGPLAALAEPGPQNRIEVTVAPQSGPEGEIRRGTVRIHAGDEVSPYVRGVAFRVRQADGLVLPSSCRCLDAG